MSNTKSTDMNRDNFELPNKGPNLIKEVVEIVVLTIVGLIIITSIICNL